MKINFYITLFTATMLFFSCSNNDNKESSKSDDKFEVDIDATEKNFDKLRASEKMEDVIFYNMFSPVDLNKVIDPESSYFNSVYLNSLSNITRYASSHKIALNIGIYGADLSYLWMFEQNQQALSYLSAIQHLSAKLGIPNNFVKLTIDAAEKNSGEIDSLIIVARDAYHATDKYLKNNERGNAAALVLFGGWIETLHIALSMYSETNSKLASKIITQKYSLASLINMVQNSSDDIVMSEYLLLMKKLNDAFTKVESKLKPENIDIDTVNKRITIKNSENININPEDFAEIKDITSKIRDHIID